MEETRDFYMVLYSALLANCPKDSRNMVDNITLTDMGTHWKIGISGPTGSYDYARKVNDQLLPTQSGPNKGHINLQWVERTIEQVSAVFGGSVIYELS